MDQTLSLDIQSQEHENIRPYISNYEFDFTLLQFHLSFSKSEFDLLQKYPRIYQKFQPHVTSTIFGFGKLNEERKNYHNGAQKIKV
jgi:hypothetical protein